MYTRLVSDELASDMDDDLAKLRRDHPAWNIGSVWATAASGPREPLPSITYLTGETGLAVGTVRKAIAVLVQEGLAYTVPGRGTFAAPRKG